ncbi:MAG: RagB/SusD family nutrient uptake outer membrane protein, partial [Candidatus Methanomethylophilaceae archaeon]
VNKYGDYGDSLMNQHIAEAKFIRAYEYLLLLQAFGDGALTGDMNGLGLILRLTPYDGYNPEDIQARATVGDTYQQIINDLQEALPFLPNVSATNLTSRTRASKTAAFALLSRVHLYKGSYSNNTADIQLAADYADSVLKNTQNYIFSTSYTHHTSWLFPLNPSGAETNSANYSDEVLLLAPHYTNANNYANGVGGSFFNKTYFSVDESFVSLYETGDRRGYFDPSTGTACLIWNGSDNYYPTEKTSYKYNNSGGYNNVLLIRLSEVKLTRAEALARLEGINDESITHLNDIYRKAFQSKPAAYTSASFANAQQLIDRILVERMKELAFEGHTRWDLIRTGRPLRNTSLTNDRKILPIPNYDVNISYGVIVQNKGYR